MKGKIYEGLWGYVFASPIILSILAFTIIPIFSSAYYSFTNYSPLEAKKFDLKTNPEEAMRYHFNLFNDIDNLNPEELKEVFDPLLFIEQDIGVVLNKTQQEAVKNYLDSERLLNDFMAGKLNREVKISDFMSEYLTAQSGIFQRYIPDWVWFDNFREMFGDEYFWISLQNSFYFSLIVVPIQTLIAVLLAVVSNMRIKGVKFFKAIFFLPSITSSAAISMIFMFIYTRPGVLNQLLKYIGIPSVDWLENPLTALPAVMIMNIWTTAGYFMITFLAGLQSIPRSIYEAADIDGAKFGTRFWKITLPLLRPQVIFVAIMGFIGCMQVFDQIYFLIKNVRNMTSSFYIYQNAFRYNRMGYASAIAWVLFAIIFSITVLQRTIIKEEAYF